MIGLTLLLSLAGSARADEPDVLLEALHTWAERSVSELSIEGAPPQRSVLAAMDHDHYTGRAVFGALESESHHRKRPGRIEVVVGDDRLNSVRFRDRSNYRSLVWHITKANLPVEDVPLALERDLWLTTDASYKVAVQRWRIKSTALAGLGGEPPPPEWTPAPVIQAVASVPEPSIDADRLRQAITDTSAVLGRIEGLSYGAAEVTSVQGRYLLATSEGTRLVQPESYTALYVWCQARRADGVELDDHLQWVVSRPEDLPPLEELVAEAEAMGLGVAARLRAPVVDYYEGPVVFEGEAAGDLLRYLLPPEVQGTPPAPEPGRTWQELTRDGPRLGRRLLPEGWSVVSEPTHSGPGIVGTQTWDREGVAPRRLELVEDGYVRDLAMTRIPRHDLQVSNGHARGSVQGLWEARLSVWTVTPHRLLKPRAFDKSVDKARDAAGLDRVLVIRQLHRGREGDLPQPARAVWRLADGSEVPVAELELEGVDRRTLRDMEAASGLQAHAYLSAWQAGSRVGRSTGLPSTLVGPASILVLDMEAVFPGPDERPWVLEPPPLE